VAIPDGPGSAHCKTVGLAYVGSNPTPATIKLAGQTRSGGPGLMRCGSGLEEGLLLDPAICISQFEQVSRLRVQGAVG